MRKSMLDLTVVSPEDTLLKSKVKHVILPCTSGAADIYPGHCALLSSISNGVLVAYLESGEHEVIYLDAGTVSVRDNQVDVFADTAFKARLEQEDKLAKDKLDIKLSLEAHESSINTSALLSKLARLNAQLNAIEKLKRLKKRG